MTDARAIWPDVPPEVPPPWHPGEPQQPQQPDRSPASPWIPLVTPASTPTQDDWGLLARRIVLLLQPLDRHLATRVAAQIMTVDADEQAEITLHVSGQEGELTAALMLADTVDLARSPVTSLARGVVGGVLLAPFCAAARRLASPNATFQMREPRASLSGQPHELVAGAEAIRQHVEQLHRWVGRATGQPEERVAHDMHRGRALTAEDALDCGLIDEIVHTDG